MARTDDVLVFISTFEMESDKKKKSYWLGKTLNMPENSIRRIIVAEDDFGKIKDELAKQCFPKSDEYIVNLTGGTKVMPLAVYEYFKNGFNAHFYYVPIGKNIIRDLSSQNAVPLNYRLNLKEYFTLYGIDIEPNNILTYSEVHTNELFEEFRRVNFNRYKVPKIRTAQQLSNAIDKAYYGGKWFEEYCFSRLKRELSLADDCICKDAYIFRDTNDRRNDNEIDVMFIKDNLLYIFECKVGMTGYVDPKDIMEKTPKDNIEKFQYKLAAIVKDFGLRVEAYILTLHKIFNNPRDFSEQAIENIVKRQTILGLRGIIDSIAFTYNESLLDTFKQKMPSTLAPQKNSLFNKKR